MRSSILACPGFTPSPSPATLQPMKRILFIAAIALGLVTLTGCKSDPGSREFIPGKGWRPV